MKGIALLLFICSFGCSVHAQRSFVQLKTNKRNITIMLYDRTPKHREMFLNQIKLGNYKNALFNRVIKDFVSQGGELDRPILEREKLYPNQIPPRIHSEIDSNIIHKRGALGAGRDDNPTKASYLNQIYLVSGKVLTEAQLDSIENKIARKIAQKHRTIYATQGGIPRLDFDYTIFGEIIEGLDIAETINKVETNKEDLPLSPVIFSIKVLGKRESARLKTALSKSIINGDLQK